MQEQNGAKNILRLKSAVSEVGVHHFCAVTEAFAANL
jgi:hypothetical protein